MDQSQTLQAAVQEAHARSRPLTIRGGGTKAFYGRQALEGDLLELSGHQGIVDYAPNELFITLRAGTPLQVLEAQLAEAGQMLPFEPPYFGPAATIGGTLACGLSGPRRPYAGSARDAVLGMRILNGQGEILRFGGQVMKNVAGYDVSRLMVGALGTLGVLLEVTLKVVPRPSHSLTLRQSAAPAAAIQRMNHWAGQPLPLSATAYDGEHLYVRLSGTGSAVQAAQARLGGERLVDAEATSFWDNWREQRHVFFQGDAPLWRLAVAPATPPLPLPGQTLIEWGGGQRWLRGRRDATAVQRLAAQHGGHGTLFRGGARGGEVFHPLAPPLLAVQQRLKAAFDPHTLLNPGRMFAAL
jgi:glycolate oxidase FAD binding subunit